MTWKSRRRHFLATTGSILIGSSIAGCIGDGVGEVEMEELEAEPIRVTQPEHLPPEDDRRMDGHIWGSGIPEEPSVDIIDQETDPITHPEGIPFDDIEDRIEAFFVDGDDAEEELTRFAFTDLISDQATLDQMDGFSGWTASVVEDVDFDEEVILYVQSWFLTRRRRPVIVRAEERPYGVHAFGYLVQTSQIVHPEGPPVAAVVRMERPEGVDGARVSLTIDEDHRVHFNSSEGIVEFEPSLFL